MKIVPEPDQLDARVPLGMLGVTIVTLGVSALLTLGVRSLAESDRAGARSVEPLPRPPAVPVAAGAPAASLFERHAQPVPTRQLPDALREYGWVNRERGVVRIPIERAKELYLSRRAGMTLPVSHGGRGVAP